MTTRIPTPRARPSGRTAALLLTAVSLLLAGPSGCFADVDLRGEASLTLTTSDAAQPLFLQADLRYVPELLLTQALGSFRSLTVLASCDAVHRNRIVSLRNLQGEGDADLYRLWLRYAGESGELRFGRQKLNFGSATLLRPLQWFDNLDPQDQLQMTSGVDAGLVRLYLPARANVWFWGLYGNEEVRGLDVTPTVPGSVEYGGRLQWLVGPGELAASFHHRRTDLAPLAPLPLTPVQAPADEDRLGLDGKWDVTLGLWLEAASVRQRHEFVQLAYNNTVCAGVDYTFAFGQGLTALVEHLVAGRSDRLFGAVDAVDVTAFSLRYPWGVIDEFHLALYRDWQTDDRFQLLRWRRSYDRWSLDLQGFAGPEDVRSSSYFPGGQALAGSGLRLVIAFNH